MIHIKMMKMAVLVYVAVGYRTHLNLTNPMSGRREGMKQPAPHVGYVGHNLNIDRSRSRSRTWAPIVSS